MFLRNEYDRTSLNWVLFLIIVLGVYALHLTSFTVFEGYSTFSNDSFSFIRLARNWSPYSDPAVFNLQTLPEHPRAPGFAWLLAITGGAESTYVGHLVVSVAMLVSIALAAWLAYKRLGWLFGGVAAIGFCLLPGVIISSMGILSENFYLLISLIVLLVYARIESTPDCWRGWFVMLFVFLCLAILTRTIGVALATALAAVATFDRERNSNTRIILALIALMSIAVWLLWSMWGADDRVPGQLSAFGSVLSNTDRGLAERLGLFWDLLGRNVSSMVGAWNHYLYLSSETLWFFLFSYALFAVCVISMILRALRLKLDAVYLCFYIGIITLWPMPEALVRFFHPIVMILLLQPLFYFSRKYSKQGWNRHKVVTALVIAALSVNSVFVQRELLIRKQEARINYPEVVHSVEYYDLVDREKALRLSKVYRITAWLMEQSGNVIPPDHTVATIKHEAYMLIAEREAVMLSTLVPYHQQLCNFKIRNVDFVFISPLSSGFVKLPYELPGLYHNITAFKLTPNNVDGEPITHILKLDREAIDEILSQAGYNCQSFQFRAR